MKSLPMIAVAGAALVFGAGAPAAAPAPLAGDKVDLTPKLKAGDKFTFKQHTVRKDTMYLGSLNLPKDPPKDAPKGDAPKGDAPTPETPKSDGTKPEVPKDVLMGAAAQPAAARPAAAQPAANQPGAGGPPASSTTSVDQTAVFELRVIEASETGASLELEFKSIVCKADLSSGSFTWDSATPPDDKDKNNPILVSYRPYVGAVTKIKLGPDGNMTSVDTDPRIDLMKTNLPLATQVQQLVGKDGIRLRWSSVLWPKDGREPVTAGQSWQNVDEMVWPQVGKFTYTTTNTLKGVKGDLAEIEIAGQIGLTGAAPGKPATGTLKEQSLTGSCLWDTKAGMLRSHAWDQKYNLDVDAMGIHITRVSEFTVTTTRE